jgi:transglutaminase-like putative cysteine protease
VTTVDTTAAEALAGGRGVCQDQAHLMLALCHVVGLPARYVTVATGRDYADVAPTSGSYVGAPGGRLAASRQVGVVAVAA